MEEIIYLPKITKSCSNHHIEYLTCYTVGFFPLTTTSLLLKRDRMRSIASDARIPSSSSAVLLISLSDQQLSQMVHVLYSLMHKYTTHLPFAWSPIVKYTSSFSLLLFLNIINSPVFVIIIIFFFVVVIIIIIIVIIR